ncbi:ubiquitin carboxyl-terminal hydrolase [Aspergillus sclerotialis]|uniref:ubiquitinyl hydrolase 1 n=1 Tax=Aspergillus sclerotialis TaxID=2070753 RepID=A0A3A2ZC02_9EURO|nr:ubiquitin carboxyl-terminal hydrolase [Aspergillus sclerotialis]
MTGLEKKDGSLPPPPDHEARSSSPGTKRTAAEITGTDQHAKSGTNADDGLPSDPMSTDSAAMTGSTNFNKAGYSEQLGSENTYSTPPSMGTGDQSKAESATESDVRPSIDDQVAKVNCAAAQPLKENQKGYVVSMSWMKRVFARSSNYTDKADTSSTEGEIGPVDNTDLALATEQPVKDETGEPFVPLRKGLQMGTDYEIVPQEGWDMIMHWYGLADGSPVIVRYTHNTAPADAVENIQYEINPPIFAIFKLSNPANGTTPQTLKDKNTPTPRTVASRTTPFQKWLRHAKSLANIDMSTKVRIWKLGTAPEGSGAAVTPVMSRGAVPTPATTNAGSFGNCLTMDLNTFLSLSDGQRQLQEGFKDQTHNANYNGRSTLDMAGFGEGEIMVVLEESLGGKGVQWVSEASQKELNFYGVSTGNKSPGNNSPGKTKTAPLPKPKAKTPPVTRNRSPVASPAKRWGSKPLGCTGLSNSGNTCYFASALQCLQNVKELTCYFLSEDSLTHACGSKHKSELNPSNPIGCRGEIASAYGHLIRSLYEGNSHVKLDHIKKKAGKYVPAFSGNGQQDSQECVLFLLDGLHEDVNRVLKKPYREKPDSTDEMIHDPEALRKFAQEHWDIYKARNDSVITDLFAAMYKSSIECPVCHKVSLHFEPYTSLTVPIPSNEVWSHVFFYFPLHGSPVRINIEVPTHFTLGNVREQAAKLMRCDPNRVVLAEITGSRFFKVFDESKAVGSKANDSSDIRDADQLAFFEVDDVPTDYSPKRPKKSFRQFEIANKTPDFYSSAADRMLIPVFNRAWLRRSPFIQKKERKLFGAPSFIVVSREEAHDYDRILRKLLRVADNMTTYDLFNDEVISEESAIDGDDADSADSKIKASSVEGEDGMVNISVREETDRNQDSGTILHSEKPIPPRYRNLFDVRTMRAERTVPLISSTFEGKNHPLMSSRIPSKPSDPENWSKGEDEDSSTSERKASDESDGYASANSSSDSDCDISPPNRRRSMQSDRSPLILPGEGIVLDWTEDAYDKLFGNDTSEEESFRGSLIWGNFDLELIESEEVKRARSRREERRRKVMTVYDCFDEFMKAEVLSSGNAWWCDSCKDFRQAIKKVGLWTAPDIIPIHLKRFSNGTWRTSKIRNYIDFPVKGLDLTRYVEAPEEGKSYIYDLFAVDNHSGSIGGGHYTAHAKNFNDDNWYNFNDSTVSGPVDAEDAKSDLAYLLFYRRRSDRPLGGKALEEITESTMRALNEGELSSDSEVSVSASGEARRLGGSSLNGSSSALVKAGAAHRAGDGGNAVENEYAEQYEPPFSNFDSSEDFFGNSNSTGQEGMNFDNDYDIGTGSVSDAFNYNDSMWSFDRASNAHLSSQMTAAPPASLYDGDHGNYPDDAASDRAVDGDETSEPEVRLASLTDGAGDFDAAYGPPTPMDITQDIPAPREDDDSDELDVVELRVNDEDDKSHSN